MSNHEERLDRYIDALNAGQSNASPNNDTELAGLFDTARQWHALRESDVPVALAAGLAGQLRARATLVTPDRHPERSVAQSNGSLTPSRMPWTRSFDCAQDDPGETSSPPRHWFRQAIHFAGAALAFTVFGLVLVLVFQGMGDNGTDTAFGTGTPPFAQLAFAANSEHPDPNIPDSPEIYLVNADGSDLVALARGAFPSWSPDGSSITYSGPGESAGAVHVMSADGSNRRRLTASGRDELMPTWSPDGQRIAFLRASADEDRDAFSLWVVSADGTNEEMLVAEENEALFYPIAWSPDGSQIAFNRKVQGDLHHIEIVQVADGETRTLIESPSGPHVWLAWSPDGSRIASMSQSDDDPGVAQVNLIDVGTGEIAHLSSTSGSQAFPAWSPDGQLIAFTGENDGMQGIYLVTTDGVEEEPRLIHSQRDTGYSWPSWSPDSTQIAVVRNPRVLTGSGERRSMVQVAVVNLDGSNLKVVADNIPLVALGPPAWRPMPSSTPVDEEPLATPSETPEPTKHSIDNATVVPNDPTPAGPDLLTIAEGVQIARAFIGDPDADLEGTYDDGLHGLQEVWVTQHHPGIEQPSGRYSVSRVTGNVVEATMPMNTTLHAPENRVTEAEAQAIAEEFVRYRVPNFDSLTPEESNMSSVAPGVDGEDVLHQASWRQQDPDSGAWLPALISVEVDLETGLIYSFVLRVEDYGSLDEPTISEEQAIQIALNAAGDTGMSDLSLRDVQLRAILQEAKGTNDGQVLREMRLVWWVQLDNVWNGTPGFTNFQVDAMTGEVIDPF